MTRDTRTLLLDAAEQVLLDDGLAGASLRRITAVAGVNVAAVNYTFGSKEALLDALLTRVMEPVLAERAKRPMKSPELPGIPSTTWCGHSWNPCCGSINAMWRCTRR